MGGEIFRTRPDRPWRPPSLLYNGFRVFPRGKVAGSWHRPPPLPNMAPRLKKSRAVPLLHLWAFAACYVVFCTFTLSFYFCFCVSVWFHLCSVLVFIAVMLLPERHSGEVLQHSNEVVFYHMSGSSTGWRFLSCRFPVLKGSR